MLISLLVSVMSYQNWVWFMQMKPFIPYYRECWLMLCLTTNSHACMMVCLPLQRAPEQIVTDHGRRMTLASFGDLF